MTRRPPVPYMVTETARRLLDCLRDGDLSKDDLAEAIGVSRVTVQRALYYLRGRGAPIHYRLRVNRWHLSEPLYTLARDEGRHALAAYLFGLDSARDRSMSIGEFAAMAVAFGGSEIRLADLYETACLLDIENPP